jgi:hypothetical protein
VEQWNSGTVEQWNSGKVFFVHGVEGRKYKNHQNNKTPKKKELFSY